MLTNSNLLYQIEALEFLGALPGQRTVSGGREEGCPSLWSNCRLLLHCLALAMSHRALVCMHAASLPPALAQGPTSPASDPANAGYLPATVSQACPVAHTGLAHMSCCPCRGWRIWLLRLLLWSCCLCFSIP